MTDWPEVSRTVYGIWDSHTHCTLQNFDWSEEDKAKPEHLRRYLKIMRERVDGSDGPAPNLLLVGDPGNGKTHLLTALFRWAVLQTDATRSCWLNLPAFCTRMKQSYGGEGDPMEEVRQATFFLGVDDIFGRDLSNHETNSILYEIIDTAHRNQASLVATTNIPKEEIEARLRPHEVSRLVENGRIWEFEGSDRRPGGW